MYQGKKISVAIAAYNGEQVIGDQLDSILRQTVVPDEIVISDDGSGDQTVAIVKRYAEQWRERTAIIVLTDNPKHGIGGNFEWAIGHCVGDYIFICAQDDVWMPEKVKSVIDVFLSHPGAEMVCHELVCIGQDNQPIPGREAFCAFRESVPETGTCLKMPRKIYAERAVSSPLISGAAMCISAELVKKCLPIPADGAEDQWLQFCAAADEELYYTREVLTSYRIHDSTSHTYGLSVWNRIKKYNRMIKTAHFQIKDYLTLSEEMIRYMDKIPEASEELKPAYRTANRVYEIGQSQIEAATSGRISGILKLMRLYRTDMRYRRVGTKNFLFQVLNLLLVSKTKRKKDLGYLS